MKTIWHLEVVKKSTGQVDLSVSGGKQKVSKVWREVKNQFPKEDYKTRIWNTLEGENVND